MICSTGKTFIQPRYTLLHVATRETEINNFIAFINMRFKTDSGITWSSLELAELVEDEESRVYFEKFKKHFGLHPFHLTNLNAALNEILSSNLNSYDPEYVCTISY